MVINLSDPALTFYSKRNSSLKICSSFFANILAVSILNLPTSTSSSLITINIYVVDGVTKNVKTYFDQLGATYFVSFCLVVLRIYSPIVTSTQQFMLPIVEVFLLIDAESNRKLRILTFSSRN
jgi:hypothetical protein